MFLSTSKMRLNIIQISARLGCSIRNFSITSSTRNVQIDNNTIDHSEITKFGSYMKKWWDDKNGPFIALHQLNNLRVPFIRDVLENMGSLNPEHVKSLTPLKDVNIIDVGCGGGFLCEPLAQLGANMTGVDGSKELIQAAKLHSIENKELNNDITYINTSLEDITDKYKNHFDAVIASEVIEHVANQKMFLKACTSVLKPGGSMFVSTFDKTLMAWLYGIKYQENIIKIIPKGTHEWEKFVPPKEIEAMLNEYNCETRLVRGFIYFRGKWFWRNSTSVNYFLHGVKKI